MNAQNDQAVNLCMIRNLPIRGQKQHFCSRNPCEKCIDLIEIRWETHETFQILNFYNDIFNLRPFPAVWHNLLINGREKMCNSY